MASRLTAKVTSPRAARPRKPKPPTKATKTKTPTSARARGLKYGYRSGLEERVAASLAAKGCPVVYEPYSIAYTKPAKPSSYTLDFELPNGIIIETKGRFITADRQKHKAIKAQHPDLDIRFVFSNAQGRISKKSKTTYARWCLDNGFLFAQGGVPQEWIDEPPCPVRFAAIEKARR